jgi:pyrroline-5-carboxylate reductase
MAASQKLAFIGAGNMAKAILKGALSKGIAVASNVTMSSPSGPSDSLRELGVNCMRDNALAVADADMVILCVKPHFVATAIASFAGSIRAGAVVVSVAAGVTTVQLEEVSVLSRIENYLKRSQLRSSACARSSCSFWSLGAAVKESRSSA